MKLNRAELLGILIAGGATEQSADAILTLMKQQRNAAYVEVQEFLDRVKQGEVHNPLMHVDVMVTNVDKAIEAMRVGGL